MRYFLVSYLTTVEGEEKHIIYGHTSTTTAKKLFINYKKFNEDIKKSFKEKNKLKVSDVMITGLFEYKNKKDFEIFNRNKQA